MKIKQIRIYDDVLPGQWWEADQNTVSYLQENKRKRKQARKAKENRKSYTNKAALKNLHF